MSTTWPSERASSSFWFSPSSFFALDFFFEEELRICFVSGFRPSANETRINLGGCDGKSSNSKAKTKFGNISHTTVAALRFVVFYVTSRVTTSFKACHSDEYGILLLGSGHFHIGDTQLKRSTSLPTWKINKRNHSHLGTSFREVQVMSPPITASSRPLEIPWKCNFAVGCNAFSWEFECLAIPGVRGKTWWHHPCLQEAKAKVLVYHFIYCQFCLGGGDLGGKCTYRWSKVCFKFSPSCKPT